MDADNAPSHLLTVLTPDRRGIIAGLSGAIEQAGGRLLEISQTVMQDYFTIVIALSLPASPDDAAPAAEGLRDAVQTQLGAQAAVTLLRYRRGAGQTGAGERYILTAQGPDRAGCVPLISDLLAERGGNFVDFGSRVVGGRLVVVAEVELPADAVLDQLQIDLQHAAAEVGLQLRLQHQRLFQATSEIAFHRIR